jgi:hypothetical protein
VEPCKAHLDAAAAVAAAEVKGLKAKLSSSSQQNCHFANQEFWSLKLFLSCSNCTPNEKKSAP